MKKQLRIEFLEGRNLPSSILYMLDTSCTEDACEVSLFGKAQIDDSEKETGVFAWGVDLQYDSNKLLLVDDSPSDQFQNTYMFFENITRTRPQRGIIVDENTKAIGDWGSALSDYNEEGIFLSGEEWVHLATAEFEVLDSSVEETDIQLSVEDVDEFYNSLIFGEKAAVEARVLRSADVDNSGVIVLIDALLVCDSIAAGQTDIATESLDLDGNGEVGTTDCELVLDAVNDDILQLR